MRSAFATQIVAPRSRLDVQSRVAWQCRIEDEPIRERNRTAPCWATAITLLDALR